MCEILHVFFYCKSGVTMKDNRNSIIKYMYVIPSMRQAMHIVPQLTSYVTAKRK